MPNETNTGTASESSGSVMTIVLGVTSVLFLGSSILFAFMWNKASKKLSETNEAATNSPGTAAPNTPPGTAAPNANPTNPNQPPRRP